LQKNASSCSVFHPLSWALPAGAEYIYPSCQYRTVQITRRRIWKTAFRRHLNLQWAGSKSGELLESR
jgi:hypothetical protein